MADRLITQGPLEVEKALTCDFPGCTSDATHQLSMRNVKSFCDTHTDLATGILAILSENPQPPALRVVTVKGAPPPPA